MNLLDFEVKGSKVKVTAGIKSRSRRLGLRRSQDAVLDVSVSSRSRENLVKSRSPSRIEQKNEGFSLVSVSGLNISFYKLIFNDNSSLNSVSLIG